MRASISTSTWGDWTIGKYEKTLLKGDNPIWNAKLFVGEGGVWVIRVVGHNIRWQHRDTSDGNFERELTTYETNDDNSLLKVDLTPTDLICDDKWIKGFLVMFAWIYADGEN